MGDIVPFRRRRPFTRPSGHGFREATWWDAARESGPILLMAPLALFAVLTFWPRTGAVPDFGSEAPPGAIDRESASFTRCGRSSGGNCVIDGDTFRYRGEKIRVADINTPEVSSPQCAYEAQLGARATARFHQLLNEGPFTLEPTDRAQDKYGRALFVVTRDGESLGAVLVREGLAEEWQGYRREWC
ncbi:thermonuclease family protein [Qipengyuania sediminis]|uniref:thermonuclease family protein n=1 Tax=Qipengyuania sediminis TaxID=1532023 RepID=UPI00105A1B18|nr:thermonuclease family protein [Qipengyuania sediminis]